jgi:cytosine/adenosine deaminase-related metal-dependent hydrolase
MIRYRADWVVPVSGPPLRDGWIVVEGGRIVGVGERPPAVGSRAASEQSLGRVAVLPGLVNAHTHLELSYLRDDIPPAPSFSAWIRQVIGRRREYPDARAPEIMSAVDVALEEAEACGTALIGDISNTLVTAGALSHSRLGGVLFRELIRFSGRDADVLVEEASRELDGLAYAGDLRTGLAAHAPYSVGPEVFRAIRDHLEARPFEPCSVHLSESAEEVEFLRDGTGPWRRLLEELGAWDDSWTAPALSPVRYLEALGFLHPRLLVVHGVQMTPADLEILAQYDVTLVTCPRSNGHTGAGAPPVTEFFASGVRVAVGTDSLASTPDLNVFAELATLRALAPRVSASELLESATLNGARALGFDREFGSIEPGKRARLIAVDVPDAVDDVEEYLVSGVSPRQVKWIS